MTLWRRRFFEGARSAWTLIGSRCQIAMPMTTTATVTPNQYTRTAHVTATTTGGGYASFNCTRILEVRDNIVVSWQWEGNNCPFAMVGPYSDWPKKQ